MDHLLLSNTKGEENMLMFQNKHKKQNLGFVFCFLTFLLPKINKLILSLLEDTFVYITERQIILLDTRNYETTKITRY